MLNIAYLNLQYNQDYFIFLKILPCWPECFVSKRVEKCNTLDHCATYYLIAYSSRLSELCCCSVYVEVGRFFELYFSDYHQALHIIKLKNHYRGVVLL